MITRQNTGAFGEEAAARFLKDKHYRILERNYRSGRNELDIIAEDKEYIVFAEVKTRSMESPDASVFGRPASAVGFHKQKCTVTCARDYLFRHPTEKQPRMDVIEVYVGESNGKLKVLSVCHMENAYGG